MLLLVDSLQFNCNSFVCPLAQGPIDLSSRCYMTDWPKPKHGILRVRPALHVTLNSISLTASVAEHLGAEFQPAFVVLEDELHRHHVLSRRPVEPCAVQPATRVGHDGREHVQLVRQRARWRLHVTLPTTHDAQLRGVSRTGLRGWFPKDHPLFDWLRNCNFE